ncbi:MAG: tRNA threonylcarbamoyladenosine dehydratase [Rhodocyclaceae bacterium]|nr:tRNA threonylcarbamoyladenosine dehydratase [Rhodocyclaceae bacterium]
MKPITTMEYSRRFGGIARLYGNDALPRTRAAHVVVVGIGGVGSWAVEALARSGLGQLTLIDLDHINESNINRQIHALDSSLGASKVLAMRQRITEINPECVVNMIEEFIVEENVSSLLPSCDFVIDAIDNVRAKAALIAHCKQSGINIITTGGAGGRLDPTQIVIADLSRTVEDALASKVRAKLRKDYGFPRDAKKKFGVDCVYSPEKVPNSPVGVDAKSRLSTAEPLHGREAVLRETPVPPPSFDASAGLACAGYGSSVAVTATFGFAAASRVLQGLLQ